MKAVIPAAGLGTRCLPLTKSMPKEMLPVVHKPVIQYVIEEAYQSGITDILIITGKSKRSLEDYLDKSNVKNKYLDEFNKILKDINIYFVRQKEQLGLGNAIGYAESFVNGDSFAVLLGDTITTPPCIKELIEVYKKYHSPIIAIEKVPKNKVDQYGIISGTKVDKTNYLINNLVEKPSIEFAQSDLAILGSYILTPNIFDAIKQTIPNKGEIQLTDALKIVNSYPGQKMYAHLYCGRRFDIGNKLDWLKANIELSLLDKEFGEDIDTFIKSLYE